MPDFASYTLCECISANFSVVGIAPMVLINVLDPAKHKVAITGGTIQVNDGVAVLEETGVLLEGLTVKSGSNTLTAGTDYTTTWNDDGTLNIVVLSTGAGKGSNEPDRDRQQDRPQQGDGGRHRGRCGQLHRQGDRP